MRAFAFLILPLLVGCSTQQQEEVSEKPKHILASEITAADAPTVGDLTARGLSRTEDEPAGWSCGEDCIADGFTAIYMGKESLAGSEPDKQFICPVGDGDMETWKCQSLEQSNG